MAAGANNILACAVTPPPPSPPRLSGNSTRFSMFRPLKSHNLSCPSVVTKVPTISGNRFLQIRRRSLNTPSSQDSVSEEDKVVAVDDGGKAASGGDGWSWTTSFLLFGFWAGLMYYVTFLSPNQTPSTDLYFLKKLLNLKGDDGFRMNEVLVSLWYLMGLWPFVYSMLLLPTARTQRNRIPVWPFLILSFFGGVYVLLPYFILWKPPPPPVEETELKKWPLNFLESKLAAGVLMASGLGLIAYAGISNGDVWKEFYQYFRQSKFIHIMSVDFILLSAFAPFWVFHDMTSRKWFDKGWWLLFPSAIPLLGPALYLLLRPPLLTTKASS